MTALQKELLPGAYRVWLSAGWNDKYCLSEADFVRSWSASPVKVCCLEDKNLVAIGRANTDGVMYAMIHDVVVTTEFRGQGFGKAVVRELVDTLQAMNLRCIQLMAALDQSHFYHALGFRERPGNGPGMEYDFQFETAER